MKYIKVENGTAFGEPFTLPTNYVTQNGTVITNIHALTDAEKIALGLYPVIEMPAQEWEIIPEFTVNISDVTVTYTPIPLADYKNMRIAKVYDKAKQILDVQTEGYSLPEIATWPVLQADILAYNADNTVIGAAMQEALNNSVHTASSLSAMLTPRITIQQNTLAKRKTLTAAINAASTYEDVASVDIETGW